MISPNPVYILLQAAMFYFVIFMLTKFVFNPVLRIIAEREARVTGDREEARSLVKRAEDRIQEYEQRMYKAKSEAKDLKAQMLGDAEKKEREILNAAREESSRMITATRGKIQDEAKALMPAMKKEAEQIAQLIAGTVIGRNVN